MDNIYKNTLKDLIVHAWMFKDFNFLKIYEPIIETGRVGRREDDYWSGDS